MERLTNPINLFWLCVLLHLIADYTLQGCLANLKQREWWKDQIKLYYQKHDGANKSYEWKNRLIERYTGDYIAGLGCHALMWSIMTYLPLMLVCTPTVYSIVVLANTVVHFVVDHLKANVHCINLRHDQLLHILQIVATIVVVTL